MGILPCVTGKMRKMPVPRPATLMQRQFTAGAQPMIKTVNLTKAYGDLYAVRDLNLDLQKGDVFGFIGPNGSGKTTTMRMLATLLQPTVGEAYVCGHSI